MLVSPSDFRVKLERTSNSSQSTGKNYLSFLDFTHNYEPMSGFFVPCIYMRCCYECHMRCCYACLIAVPGVTSLIPAQSYTFLEIDHEIISTWILLPSADSFKKGCSQLQAKPYTQNTG